MATLTRAEVSPAQQSAQAPRPPLRWVLVATGLACLVYAVAFAAGIAWLAYIGPFAWAGGFPAVTFLLLGFFFRALPAHGGAQRLSPRSA